MNKSSLLVLHAACLCCISEVGLSQQIENEKATTRGPSFVEVIDGNVNPEKVPMAVIYDIVSSALVDNGPSNCSELPVSQSEITTVAPCGSTLIEGVDPRALERLGEVVLDLNRFEDDTLIDDLCIASERSNLRSSTIEDFSTFIDNSERASQQRRVAFFEETVSGMFDAETAERIFHF